MGVLPRTEGRVGIDSGGRIGAYRPLEDAEKSASIETRRRTESDARDRVERQRGKFPFHFPNRFAAAVREPIDETIDRFVEIGHSALERRARERRRDYVSTSSPSIAIDVVRESIPEKSRPVDALRAIVNKRRLGAGENVFRAVRIAKENDGSRTEPENEDGSVYANQFRNPVVKGRSSFSDLAQHWRVTEIEARERRAGDVTVATPFALQRDCVQENACCHGDDDDAKEEQYCPHIDVIAEASGTILTLIIGLDCLLCGLYAIPDIEITNGGVAHFPRNYGRACASVARPPGQ